MTTLTINQDNFGKVLDKLYSIVSSSNNIILQYEVVDSIDDKENENIINYLKSDNGKKELEKTEKILSNIL